MENQKNLHLFAIFLVFVVGWSTKVNGEPKVPCFFIFGDSTADNGNNNNLATIGKSNHRPYGIDFPNGPTGRYCNGRTFVDIIGERLGFKSFIPSFLNVTASGGSNILYGVNYASGAAGIRHESGKILGDNIDLARQLKNHQVIISRIVEILGSESAAEDHLNKCFYLSMMGDNDYLNSYFLPNLYNTSSQYTTEQYTQLLIQDYSQNIVSLYNSGSRKVALIGLRPVGCLPQALATNERKNSSLCVEPMNEAANLFNRMLESLVDELNTNLTDAKFIYLNVYGFLEEYILNPGSGFEHKLKGCCKTNEYGLCISDQDPCEDRNSPLFYDSFHCTEFVNRVGVEKSYSSLMKIM